jgi:hypothetical protein
MGIVSKAMGWLFHSYIGSVYHAINYCNVGSYGISSMGGALKGHLPLSVKATTTQYRSFHDLDEHHRPTNE